MKIQTANSESWKPVVQLALVFAAIKFAIEFIGNLLAQHFGYGIFRDEMYYIVCGRHLAWGYVDQAPMVALQARVAELVFGFHHLAFLRSFSALAGAAKIFLTGILTWQLGGRRIAQVMSMIAVLTAPVYLAIDSFLSMNSFEPVFWMGCIVVLLLLAAGNSSKWWVVFGILGGMGLLNKPSMTFFLVALLIGLLVTPQRQLLWNRWTLAAVGLIVLISLPYLLWQIHHQWSTLVWLNNVNHSHKNVKLGPLAFMGAQMMMLNPISIFLLLPGLIWLFFGKTARGFRWIGVMYLVLLAIMIHLYAKDYYVAPVYPVLFAAGTLAWQNLFAASRNTAWLLPAWCSVMVVVGVITLPMGIPVMPPYTWIRYTRALHLTSQNTETAETGLLPQFYADRFGWRAMAAEVARIYNSLTPSDRAKAGIFCSNYGEAGAIDLFGPQYGLPQAISGHQNYYFWGPRAYTGEVVIVVGETESNLEKYCGSVQQVGQVDNPLAMPYEDGPIFLCRGGKAPLSTYWPNVKNWY
ncbi:MAG: glycosyltransferase family 39 protein [Acidobacteriota bacterium]